MQGFINGVTEFLSREDGPTAVEYAVMLALIIAVVVVSVTALGTNTAKPFGGAKNGMANVGS